MSGLYLVPCESSGVFYPAIFCQVDEGAKVWCAAWATDPVLSATADVGLPKGGWVIFIGIPNDLNTGGPTWMSQELSKRSVSGL